MAIGPNLRYKLSTATVAEKLIAINVSLFIIFFIMKTLAFLFGFSVDMILEVLVFPKDIGEWLHKPWSVLTYAFLHAGIWHILGNMLILYFSGIYFLNYFSANRLLVCYLLGAVSGALVYLLSYNFFPAFEGLGKSYLIGASAAVMAILVGVATHVPHLRVRLLLLGSVKFWWIAAALVLLDIIQIPIENPGGHLAHLGGAAFGYLYIAQLQRGRDLGSWLEQLIDWISGRSGARSGRSKSRASNLRTVHRSEKRAGSTGRSEKKTVEQAKIDAILDKIGKSGYDSLSKEEKEYLFNAGREQ